MTAPIILYFLKANLIIIGVWLFVRTTLGRDTKFRRKRIIMNCGIMLAFLLPLLSTVKWGSPPSAPQAESPVSGITLPSIPIPIKIIARNEPQVSATSPDFVKIGTICYALVAGLLIMRLAMRILSVVRLSSKWRKDNTNSVTVYRIPDSDCGPFSFFNKIYVGNSTVLSDDMWRHEYTHISQWHSVDIVVAEILTAILWINPFAWLLRREMRDNLEFLADEASLEASDRKSYQYSLLNSCLSSPKAMLCTNFNVSSIKKRIRMINRISTTSRGRWIYLIATPLLFIAITVGCASPASENTPPQTEAVETTASAENQEAPAPAVAATETTETAISEEDTPTFGDSEWALYDFLGKNLTYPQSAIDDSIEGTVIITFVIAPDGSVTNPRVKQGVRQDLDEAALSTVKKMPKWNPAPSGRESEEISLPIKFRHQPTTKPA